MISFIVPSQSLIGYTSYFHTALRPIHKVYQLCFIHLFHLCPLHLSTAVTFTLSKHPKQGLPPPLLPSSFHPNTLSQSLRNDMLICPDHFNVFRSTLSFIFSLAPITMCFTLSSLTLLIRATHSA